MVDACTITRTGSPGAFDETTGAYGAGTPTTLYTGKCRVRPRDNADRIEQAGEQQVSFWPFIVSVPMSVQGVQVDDLVTITASELDADLVGTVLRVKQVLQGTHITARRLSCDVNAG